MFLQQDRAQFHTVQKFEPPNGAETVQKNVFAVNLQSKDARSLAGKNVTEALMMHNTFPSVLGSMPKIYAGAMCPDLKKKGDASLYSGTARSAPSHFLF